MSDSNSSIVDDKILPMMTKISENKVIKAIQYGVMATMPLVLGASLIAIIANLPIEMWTNWLNSTGIITHMHATIRATMEITALYLTFMVGYFNANERGKTGVTGGIFALGSYMILMPHVIESEAGMIDGLSFNYLESNGIFPGIIIAILASSLYVYLNKKGLIIKLPSSVPPMVAQSLSPSLIAIVIFSSAFLLRVAFSFTVYGSFIDFVTEIISAPVIRLGTSIPSLIIFFTLMHLFWFFGIHPNTLLSIYLPVLISTGTANLNAFMAGEPMPYLAFTATAAYGQLGGVGNTLGIALLMPFIAKSERFKALGKLSIGPAIFNINEPLIFGMPIMLNPIFFTPMITVPIVNSFYGYLVYNLGVFDTLNPSISLPWVMPAFITPLLTIGVLGVVSSIVIIIIDALIYYPFFRKADKLALAEEKGEVEATVLPS